MRLYNQTDATAQTDSICLTAFRKAITSLNSLPRSKFSDSLLYQAHSRVGILCEVYNNFPASDCFLPGGRKYFRESRSRNSKCLYMPVLDITN